MIYLNDTWSYYYHDPYDNNWDYNSYKHICNITSVDEFWEMKAYSDTKFLHSMFFLMREHIFPCWDDVENKDGGCFTMRVVKNQSVEFWEHLCIILLGETILKEENISKWDNINGISSSPKKNFYVFKIWVKTTDLNESFFNLPSNLIHGEIQFKSNIDNIQQY